MKLIKASCCWAALAVGMLFPQAAYSACTYSLSQASRNHGHGQVNNSFDVNTEAGCTWSPVSNDSWITIVPGWTGNGTGTVAYAVAANPNIIGRTGTVSVASLTFTIRQDGAPCSYSLLPGAVTHGYAGASSSFDVSCTPGCSWIVTNVSAWVTLTGTTSNTGNATVSYTVAPNTTPTWRTNNLAIADRTYELKQRPAPCIYELSPTNTSRGYAGATGSVTVSVTSAGNCSWVVENTNAWINITANPSGVGTTNFGYQVLSNASSIPRSGTITVWDRTFLVTQSGAPCNASLAPTSSSPGAEAETRVVNVTIPAGCSWYVTNNIPWITVVPMAGTNSGPVEVLIAANSGDTGRTGVVSIAGENYTVRQDGANCTYRLSTTNRQHGYTAKTDSISLDTLSVCSWTVVNTNNWLTFAAANGVGDSNITYAVSENSQVADRSGVVLIGGQQFFVTQRGIGCPISVSPTNRPHGHGATNNTITVTIPATCSWTAVTTNSWITLATNGGVGGGSLGYSIAANAIGLPRTGYIIVEEATMSINQAAAPCTNAITPSSFTHSAAEEIGSVAVLGTPACALTITNTNSWITIISGEGDTTGSTNVIYQVETNFTGSARSGVIVIGDRNYTVNQNPVICNYKLSPAQRSHGAAGAENYLTINVSAPCPWSVINTNPWITITSNSSGIGSNIIGYAVEPNTGSPFQRVGSLIVEGQSCVITQAGVTCTYTITPDSRTHGYGGTENFFNLNTTDGCLWAASTTNDWVTITDGFGGTNSDVVTYTVAANTNLFDRLGFIMADGQTFTITQRAAICSFSLSPTNRNHGYSATTNTVFVSTTPGCSWFVDNTNNWVSILSGASGTGTGTVTYAISSNLVVAPRTATFIVAEQTFVITQAAYLCTIKLSPTNRTHGFGQTTNSIGITAGPTCDWAVVNTNEWISITSPGAGVGNGSFDYLVFPNYGNTTRTAHLFVGEELLTISQLPSTNGLAIESLLLGAAGEVTLKLNGGPPGIWEILGSSNLVIWDRVGYATNVTGKVNYNIPPSGATNRFYRAFLP